MLATARERHSQISDVITSPITHNALVFVTVPVVRAGAVRYVVQARMEYPAWIDWLKPQVPAQWVVAIDDRNGVIFARSERAASFAGKTATERIQRAYGEHPKGVIRNRGLEGIDSYVAFHTSAYTGWHVLVIVPATLVDAAANRFALGLFATFALIVALAVLLALSTTRPIKSGIGQLADAIDRLGRGEPSRLQPTRVTEIDDAGASAQRAGALLETRANHVAGLQRELSERAEAAEQANRAKDQFLAMLSYELRNPLAAISNATAVLLMRSEGTARRMQEIISRQTRHLASLVDDLLDVSRLAAGKLQLDSRRIDLAQVVMRVDDELQAAEAVDSRAITFGTTPAFVHGDPERLAQVVRNLLDNALKYTPAGGHVTISVGTENGDALLTVRDDGCGIDASLLARVFEPFVQAPQGIDRRLGGLGLGLAVVKQIIELHGGSVVARSAGVDHGCEFSIRLPLAPSMSMDDAPTAAGPPAQRRLHVAIIEDHADTRTSLRPLVEADGHTIEHADDGESALRLLCGDRVDVALVDLGLPGMNGYEVARRARRAGIRCRLIALTGYGQDADRARALESGFDDFIVKPASAERLHAALCAL